MYHISHFSLAIRWGLLNGNPFDGLATTVRENRERQEFVTWSNVLKVIEVAPTIEWKALIAFVRLVGPRVPSELVGLTWADVDFVAKRIVIKSPKTKHHGGEHAVRSCPMFPELVPYLEKQSTLLPTLVDGSDTPRRWLPGLMLSRIVKSPIGFEGAYCKGRS